MAASTSPSRSPIRSSPDEDLDDVLGGQRVATGRGARARTAALARPARTRSRSRRRRRPPRAASGSISGSAARGRRRRGPRPPPCPDRTTGRTPRRARRAGRRRGRSRSTRSPTSRDRPPADPPRRRAVRSGRPPAIGSSSGVSVRQVVGQEAVFSEVRVVAATRSATSLQRRMAAMVYRAPDGATAAGSRGRSTGERVVLRRHVPENIARSSAGTPTPRSPG